MASKKRALAAKATVKLETLEATPSRAFALLRGLGISAAIRAALDAAGYTKKDHEEGWTLLHAASGFSHHLQLPEQDTGWLDAMREVQSWAESGFRIARATLARRHPVLGERLLAEIAPGDARLMALLNTGVFLDRLDMLERSKDKSERAAVTLLAERGIDAAKRRQLRALMARAERGPQTEVVSQHDELEAAQAEHLQALIALRAWYEEWSEIAKVTVKRRDHLIRLGLAKRKPATKPAKMPPSTSPLR